MKGELSAVGKVSVEEIEKIDEVVKEAKKIDLKDGRKTKILPSAKGLYGEDFERYLSENIGDRGPFSKGGREFDGGIGNRWWEARSGPYWQNRVNNPKAIEKFKSDMGHRLKIAKDNGATYELFSNTPIPHEFKEFLISEGIPFTEILD